jgi:hypothetical protein
VLGLEQHHRVGLLFRHRFLFLTLEAPFAASPDEEPNIIKCPLLMSHRVFDLPLPKDNAVGSPSLNLDDSVHQLHSIEENFRAAMNEHGISNHLRCSYFLCVGEGLKPLAEDPQTGVVSKLLGCVDEFPVSSLHFRVHS